MLNSLPAQPIKKKAMPMPARVAACTMALCVVALALTPKVAADEYTPNYQWGAAPQSVYTIIDAAVNQDDARPSLVATIPEGATIDYLTLRYDARTLQGGGGAMLANYMQLVDLYGGYANTTIRSSSFGGGNGYLYINNQSSYAYAVVDVEFDPTVRNLNFVIMGWGPLLNQIIAAEPFYEDLYNSNPTGFGQDSYRPTQAEIDELRANYGANGMDGYDWLLYAYVLHLSENPQSFDAAANWSTLMGLFKVYFINVSVTSGFYYDMARYHTEQVLYMRFGTHITSSQLNALTQPENAVRSYTARAESTRQQLAAQFGEYATTAAGTAQQIPFVVSSSGSGSTNAFNTTAIEMDVAFRLTLQRIGELPKEPEGEEPLDEELLEDPPDGGGAAPGASYAPQAGQWPVQPIKTQRPQIWNGAPQTGDATKQPLPYWVAALAAPAGLLLLLAKRPVKKR